IAAVRPYIFRLQATTTLNAYEEVLQKIEQLLPAKRVLRSGSNGQPLQQSVAKYLRMIHPIRMTKCDNCELTLEESAIITNNWIASQAYGRPCQIFAAPTASA
ncbi:hypothetical protein L916_00742, partial [Phytophthora nicotianae]